MTQVPPPPEFGQPVPQTPSADTLSLLAQRRSTSPHALKPPAPQGDDLAHLLRLAARVPDHGKLTPWRFILAEGEDKANLVRRLEPLAQEQPDPGKAAANLGKLSAPPLAVIVVSSPKPAKIDAWEQILSAGAVCTTLVAAATAMGYGSNWITDWYSYDERARTVMGLLPGEQVAGVILLGTAAEPPLERARPDLDLLVSRWRAP